MDFLLGLNALADICCNNGNSIRIVCAACCKVINRKLDWYAFSFRTLQAKLSSSTALLGVFENHIKSVLIFWRNQISELNADQFFTFHVDHLTKARIAVKDRPI